MARKSKKTKAPKGSDVIKGDDHGKDVIEQTKEARGEDGDKGIDPGKAGSAASKPPYTDEMKARDAQIKEREQYLEDNGIDPDQDRNNPGGGLKKVEMADTKARLYQGMVTVTGVHGDTHEKISARIDLPVATGEYGVKRAFFAHHPAASREEEITIDAENVTDPNLRSRYE